jgi:endogenous inhibitor of DNA gyrase (YacG/DUF329 family)
MNDTSFGVLVGILPFVVVFLPFYLWLILRRRPNCPGCGTPLPWSSPKKTWRLFLAGGWICPKCGIDVDSNGRKVETPYVPNWAKIWPPFAALAVLGGIGIVLVCILLHQGSIRSPSPSPVPPAYGRSSVIP